MYRLYPCLLLIAILLAGGCTTPATVPATLPAAESAAEADRAPATDQVNRWESDIVAFEEADRQNPPAPGGTLFIGSSSIRGWRTLEEDFPDRAVINRGFGGSTLADSIAFVDRIVLPYRPAAVVLYAGDNDINGGLSPEQVADDFRTFASLIHEALPQTRILFISIKPSPARWQHQPRFEAANRLVEQYAAMDERITYVDIVTPMLGEDGQPRPELYQADRLHLTPAGYAIWTQTLRPLLPGDGQRRER